MKYSIGLDVGVTSVGWSIMELSCDDNSPIRIVDLGARIFDAAEHPKTGASLALPRREARGQRRRTRRRKHRKERIYGMMLSYGILTKDELETLYQGEIGDIYEIRTRALDTKITNKEFAKVLIHLSQRRGFKSNRKAVDQSDESNGKLLKAINQNKERIEEKGYRTVGEMFYKDEIYAEYKRNRGEDYKSTVDRDSIGNEARLIFAKQREFGCDFATEEIEKKYLDILLSQRSFAEGPGAGPYSGNQIDKMVGKCTFEKEENRCSKATYSFQLFNLWTHLNHIKINSNNGSRFLSQDEKNTIVDYAHNHAEVNYHTIRKLLGNAIESDETFADVRYTEGDFTKAESKKKIKDLTVYHDIRKCLDKISDSVFKSLSYEQLDDIGEIFSKNSSDEKITEQLQKYNFTADILKQLLTLPNYSKYGHLSLKAIRKILPYLKNGMKYNEACEMAGYDFKAQQKNACKFLPPLDIHDQTITNPVVKRAISQTIKVINAIIRKMDNESPVYINIELARELSKDLNERRKIEKQYLDNASTNEKIINRLKEEYGVKNPSGQDLIKFKLWEEQAGVCPYSQTHISIEDLFRPGGVDIDHIVPYSRSFDDRMSNKVLVKSYENRQKGNRLPLEYLEGEKREKFIVWVNSQNYKHEKKSLLLKEKIGDENEWKQRHLQDTQYISTYLYNYISTHLEFAQSKIEKKRKVYTVNGAVTAYARKRWGIKKIRANGDLHHAVDATVIACISQSMINMIQKHSFYKETYEIGAYKIDKTTGEVIDKFPRPWEHFLDELNIRLETNAQTLRKMLFDVNYDTYSEIDLNDINPPFVSRMSNHKITGSAHKETIKAKKENDGKTLLISKVDIKKLKLDKNDEIANYFNPSSDMLLYEALKKRLIEFKGSGEKAFEQPFKKPKSDGTDGPIVKKVKVYEPSSSSVEVHSKTAAASNDTMVRCDVFYVDGDGYYFVPIYVADTVKSELPNLACTRGDKLWKLMNESDFVFSLYPNDLIKYYSKKTISLNLKNQDSDLNEKKEINGSDGVFLYYKGLDVSTAVISGITHDDTYMMRSIGKTSLKIEKYEVDVLGNVRKIEKEKRNKFNLKK